MLLSGAQFGVNLMTTAIHGCIELPDRYPHHCLIRATAFFLMEMGISIHEERCGRQSIAACGDRGVLQGPAEARVDAARMCLPRVSRQFEHLKVTVLGF